MKVWKGIRIFAATMGFVFLCGIVPVATGADPGAQTRWSPVKPVRTVVLAGQSATAVEIKFVPGLLPGWAAGAFSAASGALSGLNEILKGHAVASVRRLFNESEAEIGAHRLALEAATGKELPDLNLWYRIKVVDGTNVEYLIDGLNSLPEVEIAYPAPLPVPPPSAKQGLAPVQSETPDYVGYQGYLKAAPGGIDAEYAWTQRGGTGGNVTIVDVEYSFNETHEDLPAVTLIRGQLWDRYGDDHGTAVLGELVALNNGYGVTGIAYGAATKFASPCNDSEDCSDYNPADAINAARINTRKGDVILLEQQAVVCGLSEERYGPLEWYQSVYEAVKLATADGRIVVEAAGNGRVNLDQPSCDGRFKRTVRDSGAIIVGAGAPPNFTQEDRSRLSFSSYGSRVDVQGWGQQVAATGYGDLYQGGGKNEWYTEMFSGTSSASPVVAGATALLSSVARERGTVLAPDRVRTILRNTGSAQQYSAGFPLTERIGPRPDLKAAIGRLPEPEIAAAPPLLPFGTLKKGVPSSSKVLTIRNRGDRDTVLVVEGVTVTGRDASEFAVGDESCTEPLGPGGACTISVTFKPSSAGRKSASLDVSSSDPKKPTLRITLSGNAPADFRSATSP